jgi:hypothetical protein
MKGFYDGQPCVAGHTKRYRSNGNCVECSAVKSAARAVELRSIRRKMDRGAFEQERKHFDQLLTNVSEALLHAAKLMKEAKALALRGEWRAALKARGINRQLSSAVRNYRVPKAAEWLE